MAKPASSEEEGLGEMTAGATELLLYGARAGGRKVPPAATVAAEGGGCLARHHEQAALCRMH